MVVKGGTNANHYDYLASAVGPQTSDTVLHSPPKGNRYDNLSHVTICYDEPPPPPLGISRSSTTVTPTEYSTTTTVRSRRVSAGWTIKAFQDGVEVASAVTGTDGNYSMELGAGTYVVCEVLQDAEGPFDWQQSVPAVTTTAPVSQTGWRRQATP